MSSGRPDLAIWPAAVNAALLGTDRVPPAVEPADDSLGAVAATLVRDATNSASALLGVAAAATIYRRCGWLPGRTNEPLPKACAPDGRPMCSPAAAALLRRMIQGEHESLLGTWLALAARHEVRAPSDVLHNLLERGRRDTALRTLVRAVGGTRATWLAALNDDWSFAIAGEDPDALVATWETGTGAARVAALQQLRMLDPERARAMLESSWARESPADRAGFVGALAQRLGPADESFLEQALDDRRKEVRQQASALLARMPSSALVARMTERARGLLTLGKSTVLRRPRIEVALPETADDALVRDGVNSKPPAGTGIGERAWWLAQIVGAVPPSTWTTAWSVDASTVLRAAEGTEWRESLVAGWLTATERHRDEAWAQALWESDALARVDLKWGAPSLEVVFTTTVSPDRVDAELRGAIGAAPDALRGGHRVLAALLGWPNEWSDALARVIALRLKAYAGADRVSFVGEFGIRALLERSARAVPISAADPFLEGWPEQSDVWPTWAPAAEGLASVLRFRKDLHLAFNEESRA